MKAWVETYADQRFGEAVRTVIAITDRAAMPRHPGQKSRR
jgi:thiaminase